MGQCSSTSKQQRSKPQPVLERFDTPVLEEEEDEGDIVEPQLSGPRQQRRAIDERARRDSNQLTDRKDYGLTALRPSLDESTCTALLALRMGRGSSVGGLLNTTGSIASGEHAPSSGDCSPKAGARAVDAGKVGLVQRQSTLSKPPVRASTDSNERLEKILSDGGSGNAPRVPPISAQG